MALSLPRIGYQAMGNFVRFSVCQRCQMLRARLWIENTFCFRESIKILHSRHYSDLSKNDSNNTNKVNQDLEENCTNNSKSTSRDNLSNIERYSDSSILDNDPDLKSIIDDIKKDFANEKAKDFNDPSNVIPSASNHGESTSSTKPVNDVEYEYSLAEDIEEYEYINEHEIVQHQMKQEKSLPIELKRGLTGVFDLEELIQLLDHFGGLDIVSFPVPPEAKFCDDMVVVSAKSRRHLQAICEELVWVHKRKKSPEDPHLLVEGLNKSDWCAMDIGNIVVHVFYGSMRQYYDIESLWTLGPEKDPKCQETDHDPYALSAEDLFWLEAAKSGVSGSSPSDGSSSSSNDRAGTDRPAQNPEENGSVRLETEHVSDRDAGWGGRTRPT